VLCQVKQIANNLYLRTLFLPNFFTGILMLNKYAYLLLNEVITVLNQADTTTVQKKGTVK
jgi:hypothetical protein